MMNPQMLLLLTAALIGSTANPSVAAETKSGFEHFITRSGDKLMDGDREWRFIGANIPQLVFSHDGYLPALPTSWEQEDAFKSMQQMGLTALRIFAPSIRKSYAESESVRRHILSPGKFDDEAFRVFDKVFELANRYGIRVYIPLVDNYPYYFAGYQHYAYFRRKDPSLFWSDLQLKEDFKTTIRYLANRRNHYTGILWKDDPALFAWSFGNELTNIPKLPEAYDDWCREMAAFIKSVAPRQLVMDSTYDSRAVAPRVLNPKSLDDPNIDIVEAHHYFKLRNKTEREVSRGRKPYVAGEFGGAPTPEIREYLDKVIADGTAGALLWAMTFHSEQGGFRKHTLSGAFGAYRTVNWPGFDDGTAFDEKGIAAAVRDAAYKMRGLPVPSPAIPDAPVLFALPATLPWQQEGHVAQFNWRGSAGATGYRLERATSAEGPFAVVGDNLPDGHLFYQPLATDASAEVGRRYFYRLKAITTAGESAPSPIIGPVVFRERLLIDELRDLTLTAAHTEGVEVRTKEPQPYYEDLYRAHRKTGRSTRESLTYRTPSGVLASFRVTVFGEGPVTIEVSDDGERFQHVTPLAKDVTPGYVSLWLDTDYIQTRTVYAPAAPLPASVRRVRISFETAVIGRVVLGFNE